MQGEYVEQEEELHCCGMRCGSAPREELHCGGALSAGGARRKKATKKKAVKTVEKRRSVSPKRRNSGSVSIPMFEERRRWMKERKTEHPGREKRTALEAAWKAHQSRISGSSGKEMRIFGLSRGKKNTSTAPVSRAQANGWPSQAKLDCQQRNGPPAVCNYL